MPQSNGTPPRPGAKKKKLITGSVVVVASVPKTGQSKTRMIPLLGADGSKKLATAMLADVLSTLSEASFAAEKQAAKQPKSKETVVVVDRVLLYAPGTRAGKLKMIELLQSHNIPLQEIGGIWKQNAWTLIPLTHPTDSNGNRPQGHRKRHHHHKTQKQESKDLGSLMEHALNRVRHRQRNPGPVVFLGMESPQVPLDEIAYALGHPEVARLCPTATDGGYGLLSVPHPDHVYKTRLEKDTAAALGSVFAGVRWSDPLTAVSQMKALTDQKIPVTLGRLMYSIDQPEDVMALIERMQLKDLGENYDEGAIPATPSADKAAGTPSRAYSSRNLRRSDSGLVGGDVLMRSTYYTPAVEFSCPWTQQALDRLGLWPREFADHVPVTNNRGTDSPLSIVTREEQYSPSPTFYEKPVVLSDTPLMRVSTQTRIETPVKNKRTSSETISVEQVLMERAGDPEFSTINFMRGSSMYSL